MEYIGKSHIRVDAYGKVTGKAKYTADLCPKDALVAKVLHSTIANGEVVKIDTTEAKKVKGVVAIFTCVDFLIIIITLSLFSSENKEISDLSYRLVGIFFVDIIVRFYHIYLLKKDISNLMLKEIISCVISVDQFYLILYLFFQI